MKVKFLRKYGKHKIDEVAEITLDKKEKDYVIKTGTLIILEDDIEETVEKDTEEIPEVIVPNENEEEEKKDGRKKGGKKE